MKFSTISAATLLAAQCSAAHVVDIPLNLQIQDTEIPQEMAQRLLSKLPQLSPDKRYEQLFVGRNGRSQEYVCAIPPANSTLAEIVEKHSHDREKDSNILAKAIDIVHASFPSSQCVYSYDLRGFYWTYGYCHADKIIQYHETAAFNERPQKHVPGSPNMVYVLGRFSKSSANEVTFKNQASPVEKLKYIRDSARTFRLVDEKVSPFSHLSQKVLLQMASDGSICDMTWQPRSTEVVYKCDANGGNLAHIIDVAEIKTCHYRLFVHVPNLCQYEPFAPNKDAEELVDVTCQRVSENPDFSLKGLSTFEDYSHHQILRQHSPFPVPSDNRINVAMHSMVALSRGFYLAKYNGNYRTTSDFYNHRNVILFNGFHASLDDLNLQLGRTIYNNIGKNLLAPHFNGKEQVMLSWKHSFIMWFEVYNFKGEFLGISRLLHDGSNEKKVLGAQIFDPITLLDIDGDDSMPNSFNRPEFEAPYNMWNYEMFLASGQSPVFSKKSTDARKGMGDDMVELTKTVVIYNDGIMADGSPNVAVFEDESEVQLPGQYNKKGEYVFTYEPNPGQAETFTAVLVPGVEFYGYPITYLEPRSLAELKMLENTRTVTQTEGEVTEVTSGDNGAEESEEKEKENGDEIQEVDDINREETANKLAHDLQVESEELLDNILIQMFKIGDTQEVDSIENEELLEKAMKYLAKMKEFQELKDIGADDDLAHDLHMRMEGLTPENIELMEQMAEMLIEKLQQPDENMSESEEIAHDEL